MIIADIILRQYKWNLARRKKNLSRCHCTVIVRLSHIVNTDHDITLFIHGLRDLVEFIDRCHDLIVIRFFIITVKGFRRIFDQCMIKNMRHFFQWP